VFNGRTIWNGSGHNEILPNCMCRVYIFQQSRTVIGGADLLEKYWGRCYSASHPSSGVWAILGKVDKVRAKMSLVRPAFGRLFLSLITSRDTSPLHPLRHKNLPNNQNLARIYSLLSLAFNLGHNYPAVLWME
jgi:hypothetical protein